MLWKIYPMRLNSFLIRFYKLLKRKTRLLVYFPLLLYWISLFILTTIPVESVPKIFDAQDKIEHILAYFILALLLSFTLHFQQRSNFLSKHYFYATFIFIILYATIDELHQIVVPGRYCEFLDWSADILGGILGLLLSKKIIGIKNAVDAVDNNSGTFR